MEDKSLQVDLENCALGSTFERSASAPSSPSDRTTMVHREIAVIGCHGNGRRVTFPDDDTIVTDFFEAPDPWSEEFAVTTDNIVAAYRAACWKQGVKPLQRVLQHLQNVHSNEVIVEFELNLKGEHLDSQHCEALEEVFKRLQFKTLELENCHLDDEGAAAIFDMIEYYDSTSHLNISGNRSIGSQGWHACSKMLKRTPCLQYLDARNTAQNEQSLLILGRAFRTGSNLSVLHLENCGLTGRPLVILVAALKLNNTLSELYLGENKISSADGLQLANLLRSNSILELLDLRQNNLQDLGICHLMDGLCQQIPSNGNCLKSLVLAQNHLTHHGMIHVSQALLVSASLSSLDLSDNNIYNEGMHLLKQGLLHNQALENLYLRNTKISCEGTVTLAEYVADNQHIVHIDLRNNDIKVAGIMALSLSMRHNNSITSFELDEASSEDMVFDSYFESVQDGLQDHKRLIKEIKDYCGRNKKEIEEDNNKNFTPVVHNNSTVYPEKTPVCRTASINVPHSNSLGMVCSASFPAGAKGTQHHTSNTRNRFQVCRVFLDNDLKKGNEEGVFFPPSSDENDTDGKQDIPVKPEIHVEKDNADGTLQNINSNSTSSNKPEHSSEDTLNSLSQPQNVHKNTPKKIAFLLPEDADLETSSSWKDRRMSTPVPSSVRLVKEHHDLRLKLGRQLEGLDLRSSVPLSPTRLREGLVFSDLFDLKFPPESPGLD